MKKIFYSLCSLFFFQNLNAQRPAATFNVVNSSTSSNFSKITSYGYVNSDNGEPSPDTVGSPYLVERYQVGSIIKDSVVLANNIALRYNVYDDIFIGKVSLSDIEDEAKAVIKSEEFKIKMGNNLFIALPSYGNPNSLQYYQLLVDGTKGTLYKKNEKVYKERVIATTSLTRDIPPAFKDKVSYFFVNAQGNFKEISTSKKKILEIFKGSEKQMKEYIKKNKLSLKDEKDLISLFKFYETL